MSAPVQPRTAPDAAAIEAIAVESGALPDRIHLYRRAILEEWIETGVGLEQLVAHVMIHEVGHHFGLSDEDMHALEDSVA
jgi:predicted Zn-dependent protease with MMP-like domain